MATRTKTRVMNVEVTIGGVKQPLDVRLTVHIADQPDPDSDGGVIEIQAVLTADRPSRPLYGHRLVVAVGGENREPETEGDGDILERFNVGVGTYTIRVQLSGTGLAIVDSCNFKAVNADERAIAQAKIKSQLAELQEKPAKLLVAVADDIIKCEVRSNLGNGIKGDVVVTHARRDRGIVPIGTDGKGEIRVARSRNENLEYTVTLVNTGQEEKAMVRASIPPKLRDWLKKIWA